MSTKVSTPQNIARSALTGGGVLGFAVLFQFVVGAGTQVLLARILEPEIFGILAFVTTVGMVLASVSNLNGDKYVVFQEGDPKAVANVIFTIEFVTASVAAIVMIGIAPAVMGLLGKSDYTIYVQFLTISYFYSPFVRPRSLFERDLRFARSRSPALVAQLISAGLAISLALMGFGIWGLLVGRVSVLLFEVAILWILGPYRLKFAWSREITKSFMRFSWPLTGSAVLVFAYSNIDYMIVGQFLVDGQTQLGYYWLGFQVSTYFLMGRQVLMQTLFPIFTRISDTKKNDSFAMITHTVGGITLVPTVIVLFFGDELIQLVYGSKWGPAVLPFQIIFFTVLVKAISANLGYFVFARGETRAQFQSALIYAVVLPPLAYFGTINFGIEGTAVSVVITQIVVTIYSFEKYSKPVTGFGVIHFFWRPVIVCAIAVGFSYLLSRSDVAAAGMIGGFMVVLIVGYLLVFRSTIKMFNIALKAARTPATDVESSR